jgi:hypothetical protein
MNKQIIGAVLFALAVVSCGGGGDSPSSPGQPTPAAVASVVISGTGTVEIGKTLQLTAQAQSAAGTAISGKTFTWASGTESVASVASDGTVTGRAAGTATITATVDGKSGSAVVTVTPALVAVGSVIVSGTAAVQAGSTTKLTALVKDVAGNTLTTVPVTWSSSDAANVSVSSDGTVNAVHIATATITATANGKAGTLEVTSSLTPYTFSFPDGTSDAQRIRDAVQAGHAFFLKTFGRTITKPTTVTGAVSSPQCDNKGGNAALAVSQAVTFCVSNQGWTANGPIARQKITIHELFHVWQYEYKWLGGGKDGSAWIVEGSAELMGFNGVDAMGLLPIATAKGCQIKQVADFNTQKPPGFPSLSTVEPLQAFQSFQGPLYTISFVGMDQLTAGAGGLVALKTYGDAIAAGNGSAAWVSAFQTAFGMSTTAFYAQFPAYNAALPVPPNYLCGV